MDEQEKDFVDKANIHMDTKPLLTTADAFDQALSAVKNRKSIILFGPPGTGKTRLAYLIKSQLETEDSLGKFETVQFHHKFTYEDFMEGYSPNSTGGFDRKDGVFKNFIKTSSPLEKTDILLIDEINRADLTTTFGELLFLMDDRGERSVKTSHFAEDLKLPKNTVIIGTMNTADRNIASLDFALRRRFVFIPLYTDYDELLGILTKRNISAVDPAIYVAAAKRVNSRIGSNRLMGSHMELGTSMWLPSGEDSMTEQSIADVFRQVIIPQVEAYCGHGYEDQLAMIFNQNVSQLYLGRKKISDSDILGLIKDLAAAKR